MKPDLSSRPYILAAVVLVAAILFALMIPSMQVGTWTDDAIYITMAQSLLQGKGLSLVYLPTDPTYPVVPVGYPLLLAPVLLCFPGSFLPLKLLSSGLVLLTVPLVYHYTRRRLGHSVALLSAILFATNVAIVQSAAQIMSEALFVFCILWAVLETDRFVERRDVRWHHVLLTAFLIVLPAAVRYLGSPVVAALMAYVLWRRRDRFGVGTVVLGATILVAVNVGVGGVEVGRYYVDRISGLASLLNPVTAADPGSAAAAGSVAAGPSWLGRLVDNIQFLLLNSVPGILVPLFHGPRIQAFFERLRLGFVPLSLQLGIDLLLFLGLIQQLRRKARAGEWIVLAYCATLVVLPTDWETLASRFRYWIPLIPFGYIYLMSALRALHRYVGRKAGLAGWAAQPNGLVIAVAVCLLALNLGRVMQESLLNPLRDRAPDLAAGSEWLEARSDVDDVIMAQFPRVYALYLAREVVPYPVESWESKRIYSHLPGWPEDSDTADALCEIVDQFGVDYVVISPALVLDQPPHWTPYVEEKLLPAMHAQPEKFHRVWISEDGFTQIYRIVG